MCVLERDRRRDPDTTSDHGGGGEGIRPYELLEAALATCLNMTVRMAAAERGIDVDGVRTTVDLDLSGETPTFGYAIDVAGVEERTAADLRDAVVGCPVHETLDSDPAVVERPSIAD